MQTVHERLRVWREERGLTRKDVGIAVGEALREEAVPPTTVQNYEVATDPTYKFLTGLKAAYGSDVDLLWLLLGEHAYGVPDSFASAAEVTGIPTTPARWQQALEDISASPDRYPEIFKKPEELTPTERYDFRLAMTLALRRITRGF